MQKILLAVEAQAEVEVIVGIIVWLLVFNNKSNSINSRNRSGKENKRVIVGVVALFKGRSTFEGYSIPKQSSLKGKINTI